MAESLWGLNTDKIKKWEIWKYHCCHEVYIVPRRVKLIQKNPKKTVGVLSGELWDRRQKGKVGHKLLSYIGE